MSTFDWTDDLAKKHGAKFVFAISWENNANTSKFSTLLRGCITDLIASLQEEEEGGVSPFTNTFFSSPFEEEKEEAESLPPLKEEETSSFPSHFILEDPDEENDEEEDDDDDPRKNIPGGAASIFPRMDNVAASRGVFIDVEGVNGSGVSFILDMLLRKRKNTRPIVQVVRYINEKGVGAASQRYIAWRNDALQTVKPNFLFPPLVMCSMFANSQAECQSIIAENLAEGNDVVMVNYCLTDIAHLLANDTFPLSTIAPIEMFANCIDNIMPDVVFNCESSSFSTLKTNRSLESWARENVNESFDVLDEDLFSRMKTILNSVILRYGFSHVVHNVDVLSEGTYRKENRQLGTSYLAVDKVRLKKTQTIVRKLVEKTRPLLDQSFRYLFSDDDSYTELTELQRKRAGRENEEDLFYMPSPSKRTKGGEEETSSETSFLGRNDFISTTSTTGGISASSSSSVVIEDEGPTESISGKSSSASLPPPLLLCQEATPSMVFTNTDERREEDDGEQDQLVEEVPQ